MEKPLQGMKRGFVPLKVKRGAPLLCPSQSWLFGFSFLFQGLAYLFVRNGKGDWGFCVCAPSFSPINEVIVEVPFPFVCFVFCLNLPNLILTWLIICFIQIPCSNTSLIHF